MSTAARPYLRSLPHPDSGEGAPERISDDELIGAIERGDQNVASQIHDRLFPVIDHALVRVFGYRNADHEDLIQMSFEQVILTLSRRTFARACSLTTWASAVATRVGLNALRSRQREGRVIERNGDSDGQLALVPSITDVERETDARARLDVVRECLAQMNPDAAKTLFLHDALGYKLVEIAGVMGVSLSAAQSRLVRARKDLFGRIERQQSRRLGGQRP